MYPAIFHFLSQIGMFVIRLFVNYKPIYIVIDSYLPTKKNELIFAQSTLENEFWPGLVEKAAAKLYGSYQSLLLG